MKKLLVLLALCMVLSVVLVACTTPEEPTGETTTGATEAPTTDAGTDAPTTTEPGTDAPTTEEPTTEEPTTEAPTTEEPGTTEPEPEPVKVVAGKSWDSMHIAPANKAVFADGYAFMEWEKNPVVEIDQLADCLRVYGWVAYFAETEGTVGYKIGNAAVVYGEGFTDKAESGVQDHVAANVPGGKSACRMHFDIPVADLKAGDTTLALYAKDPDGNEELIMEFKVTKTLPFVEGTQSNLSVDNILLNNVPYVTEGKVVAEMATKNNTVTVMYDQAKESISVRGWVAFAAAPAVECGYYIGREMNIITDAAFAQDRPDLAGAGIVNGKGYNISASIADLPAGTYPVGIIAKLEDGSYVQFYSFTLRIIPELEDKSIILGVRDGNPFVGSETKFGQKVPLGENFLNQVTINDLATYADGNENTWSFKVWQWNTDYETTVAAKALYEVTGENHQDNSTLVVDVPMNLLICGDIYYELEYTSGAKNFTPWIAKDIPEGVVSYVNGQVKEGGYAASVMVGTPVVAVDPMAPIAVGDAAYIANCGSSGASHTASAVLSEDGSYVTLTSTDGGDPNFFVLPQGSAIKGVKYIAIKYRTSYTGDGADGEFFVGSTTISGNGDTITIPYTADGEWNVAILDISTVANVNEEGLVNYLRFDYFKGAKNASIDVANIVLFSNEEAAYTYYGLEVPAAPVEPEGFVISAANADGLLYVTGTVTGGRFDGSFNVADAAVFFKEEAGEGLYKLYYMAGDAKTYIIMEDKAAGGALTTDAAAATVFEWNATYNTHEVADDDNARAFGCGPDSTYTNFSAYALSNADKYNWGQSTPVSEIETPDEPETPVVENYNVPMDVWAVTGHAPGLTDTSSPDKGPMIAAGGIEKGALLHQGYIGIGEIDLSKYSKVVISYGIDNSPVTVGHYNNNANNRVLLCKADAAMTNSPTEDNIIASATYTLQGWNLVTVEIDLTAVDYNGPVFVTYDTLPGTFMLIGAIEFVA